MVIAALVPVILTRRSAKMERGRQHGGTHRRCRYQYVCLSVHLIRALTNMARHVRAGTRRAWYSRAPPSTSAALAANDM